MNIFRLSISYPQRLLLIGILIAGSLIPLQVNAQSIHKYSSKKIEEFTDSLKNTPYPYNLPIWGKKVQAKGFDIPRPMGFMLSYSFASQQVKMDRLLVSLDDENYTDVTDIVSFNEIHPEVNVVTVRPDLYILPFLNISGLVGYYDSNTPVDLEEPFQMLFNAKNSGPILGFGATLSGGIGPVFASYQFNTQWSFSDNFLEPNQSFVNGIRVGHQHKNHMKPLTGWTVWLGAESIVLGSQTLGKVNMSKITGITEEDKQQAADELEGWFNDLAPPLQDRFEH